MLRQRARQTRKQKAQRGFSLIELSISIVILAVLSLSTFNLIVFNASFEDQSYANLLAFRRASFAKRMLRNFLSPSERVLDPAGGNGSADASDTTPFTPSSTNPLRWENEQWSDSQGQYITPRYSVYLDGDAIKLLEEDSGDISTLVMGVTNFTVQLGYTAGGGNSVQWTADPSRYVEFIIDVDASFNQETKSRAIRSAVFLRQEKVN